MSVLRAEARAQGYSFIETTVAEWESGVNRFDGPGELFCGVFDGESLIAVGGLTMDPFLRQPDIARIRRVYVLAAWRNQGVGASMVNFLVGEAEKHFRAVRLRAENSDAARLYERLGFQPLAEKDATHVLWLKQRSGR